MCSCGVGVGDGCGEGFTEHAGHYVVDWGWVAVEACFWGEGEGAGCWVDGPGSFTGNYEFGDYDRNSAASGDFPRDGRPEEPDTCAYRRRGMTFQARWRLPVMFFVAILAGCAELGSGGVDGPVIVSAPSNNGEDAEISGTISLEGECLYVNLDDVRFPVVWPNGSRWEEEAQSIVLPGGVVVEPGDFVEGGGGYHQPDRVGVTAGPEAEALAQQCAEQPFREVAIFNASGDIQVMPAGN